MTEFELIERYFRPLTLDRPETGALKDDAAVLTPPAGCDLVVTSDTVNAGRHFLPDDPPETIARKALRVNLSDLAAMSANPLAYQLNIAFSQNAFPPKDWLDAFTGALRDDQIAHNLFLLGGDTTVIDGPLSISITAFGTAPHGKALRRAGAKPGDRILITGPVGDSGAGLDLLQDRLTLPDDLPQNAETKETLIRRYREPEIVTSAADLIRIYAHAAADISDGLPADLGHICKASGVCAEIMAAALPLSPEIRALHARGLRTWPQIVGSGDDYKLVLTVPPEHAKDLCDKLKPHGLHAAVIGSCRRPPAENAPLTVRLTGPDGKEIPLPQAGWTHF